MNLSIRVGAFLVAIAPFCLASCGPSGPRVTLNERVYNIPDMTLFAQGCSYYVLSDNGGQTSSGAGSTTSGFAVEERSSGAQVVVVVSIDGQVLVQRNYDEAFFQSGRVDQFTAMASTGKGLLSKYWGTVETDYNHHCAAFDDAGVPDASM